MPGTPPFVGAASVIIQAAEAFQNIRVIAKERSRPMPLQESPFRAARHEIVEKDHSRLPCAQELQSQFKGAEFLWPIDQHGRSILQDWRDHFA